MSKYLLLVIFLLLSVLVYSRDLNFRILEIQDNNESIYILKTDSSLTQVKPIILFIQGSLPIPLVVNTHDGLFIPSLNNFNYDSLSASYHFIVISPPNTPPLANEWELNNQLAYVTGQNNNLQYDSLYLQNNFLEKYVERGNKVLSYLRKQAWVDSTKIIIAGHSQGTYVATKLVRQNSDILALGYFSGNPNGRFTQMISKERLVFRMGKQTASKTQENINLLYDFWRKINKDPSAHIDNGDLSHTWLSFTTLMFDDLCSIKQPVYVAYGTEDIAAEGCDFLPIYFEKANKENYKIVPFVGFGHNFEEINIDGTPNYNNFRWEEAFENFLSWINIK